MKLRLLTTVFVLSVFLMATTEVEAAPDIVDFELEIELQNDGEFEIEFEVRNNEIEAKYQIPGKATQYGQGAYAQIKSFLKQLTLSREVNQVVLMNQILTSLQVEKKDVAEFELKVKFDNGKKIKIER